MRMLLVAVCEHYNNFLSNFVHLSVLECCMCVSSSRHFANNLPYSSGTRANDRDSLLPHTQL